MTTTQRPTWTATDDDTADLLTLLADDGSASPSKAEEWSLYVACLKSVAVGPDQIVNPNDLRTAIAGRIKPQRVGAFCHRALSQGLVAYTGNYVVSTDRGGRNSGRPARVMRWVGDQR